MKSFDSHGWLTLAVDPSRQTAIAPPSHEEAPVVGQPWPNFTGNQWVMANYVEPPAYAPEPINYGTRVTRLAFRNRFTGTEKVNLYTAATSNAALRVYLDDLAAATFVDLTRADTIASVNALATAGVITGARATAILTDSVQVHEVPV